MAFGLLMFISTVRFLAMGWVNEFYLVPQVHFTYFGFGWVKPLPAFGMYLVFALMLVSTLLITLGLYYRISIIGFFLLFSYLELLDKSFYLNHYYFVSLLSFLLIFLPPHKSLSLDACLGRTRAANTVPLWTHQIIKLQLALVYFFAGIAKLNPDWLFQAQPLRIWLRANTDLALIGGFFDFFWVALLMSWAGMLYDLCIPFLLFWRKTRPFAYLAVIAFHILTALVFPIGMFPWIMLVSTLIFFDERDVLRLTRVLPFLSPKQVRTYPSRAAARLPLISSILLGFFFMFQIGLCLRHFAYPGNVLWTEEGYRFSWRVMLAEKTGQVLFTLKNNDTGENWLVFPSEYLSPQQQKQMSFQADMILQFAHFLRDGFEKSTGDDISVFAEAYVSLNGRPSQLYLDPGQDLAKLSYDLAPRAWILPFFKSSY